MSTDPAYKKTVMEETNDTQRTAREIFLLKEVEQLRDQLAGLQAENDLKTFILDSIPDYVSYVDADLTYQLCNRKYEIEKGMTREKFLGKHVIEFVGKQGFARIQPYVDRVLKGELVTYEDHIDYKYLAEQDVTYAT
jgi:transcriptional regulator with PAS, ATPase and Fis domain